mmetsp:Transcript_22883/g.63535  ORF Transcript_22883/g.63535 Transcript_22883/m.63535 type:complete len:711 (+) Transcript_22883:814-2946(+)
MNLFIDASPSLTSTSSLPAPTWIAMYCSMDCDRNSIEGYRMVKEDHITPLTDKFYGEELNENTCRSTSNTSARTDAIGVNLNLRQQDFVDPRRRWSVGKISVLILIAFTFADVFIHMADAQIKSLESHDHYDALSADVIRPAFRYHGESSHQKSRPSMGLGSAAISSITTTLSPILPFTGGIDLRREDYWTDGLFGSFHSVVEHVRIAFQDSSANVYPSSNESIENVLATPRGGAAVSAKTQPNNKPKSKKKSKSSSSSSSSKPQFILSNTDCFVPLKDIAESTLKDITMSFRYAVESTQRGFNSGQFLSGILPQVKKMIERTSVATTMARGKDISAPITAEPVGYPPAVPSGDIDAINFCAAMRIFAEWRVLRQVPPGYKGYAVGIGLGQKDIVQNIAKIEQAIHDYVDRKRSGNEDSLLGNNSGIASKQVLTSPTLRDLLQYEVDTDLHDNTKLPRLKEKSAAMGLLWVRRQLMYQTSIFNNVLEVGTRFDSSRAAVQAAYDEVYGNLHGWAVQKIFSYSFQAAPEGIEIYKYMNPHRLEEVQQEAKSKIMGTAGRPRRKNDNNPFSRFGRHVGKEWDKIASNVVNEWEKLFDNVGNEWDKVTGNIGQLFGQPRRTPEQSPKKQRRRSNADKPDNTQNTVITADPVPTLESDEDAAVMKETEMQSFIDHEMRQDAYEHIKAYLEVVDPLLEDLSNLIDEFNMDDPTKV